MKIYYKLIVTAALPHDIEVAHVNAFCLMQYSRGKKWIMFIGCPDDIVAAFDSLKDYGYMVKKVWLRE